MPGLAGTVVLPCRVSSCLAWWDEEPGTSFRVCVATYAPATSVPPEWQP